MAPIMVYFSMIYLLWRFICRSEYDVSTRHLRTLFTYWCHVCCLRFISHITYTLRSIIVHPKDKTPKEHQYGTIYNIMCDIDSSHTYIRETNRTLSQRFKEHTNLDKPTGVGDHCRATGHSVSMKNTNVLTRESNPTGTREKWRRPYTSDREPLSWTEIRDTICLPSTIKLSRRNLRQHTWHQYVIKARSWRVETSHSLRQIKLQRK